MTCQKSTLICYWVIVQVLLFCVFSPLVIGKSDKESMGLKGQLALMVQYTTWFSSEFGEFREQPKELDSIYVFDWEGFVRFRFYYGHDVPVYYNYGVRDPHGNVLRITKRVFPPYNNAIGMYNYEYDERGRQVKYTALSTGVTDPRGESAFEPYETYIYYYDNLNRHIGTDVFDRGGLDRKIIVTDWDERGRGAFYDLHYETHSMSYSHDDREVDAYGNTTRYVTYNETFGGKVMQPASAVYRSYFYFPIDDSWDEEAFEIYQTIMQYGLYPLDLPRGHKESYGHLAPADFFDPISPADDPLCGWAF